MIRSTMAQGIVDAHQNGIFRGSRLPEVKRFNQLTDDDFDRLITSLGLINATDEKLIAIYLRHFNSIRTHYVESNFRGVQSYVSHFKIKIFI